MKTMANWEKLNQKFDKVFNSLTDADWENWAKNRESRKAMRKQQMLLKARMQEEKIYLDNIKGQTLFSDKVVSSQSEFSQSQEQLINPSMAGEYNYAMAA